MLDVHKRCYVNEVIESQSLQPKGFITFTFLATAIISGIIGWIVRRILDRLVLDNNNKVCSSN